MRSSASTTQALIEWIASSRDDLRAFPEDVRDVIGYALYLAQNGGKHPDAKPLTGDRAFRGAGVLEVVDDFDGDTYRAVYTVRYAGVLYVLDAFQKKSKKGAATPKGDINRIKRRLKLAKEHFDATYGKREAG